MRKLIFLFVLMCSFQKIYSQEIYMKGGRNYTNYVFKNTAGNNVGLQSGSGSFYEVGYVIPVQGDVLKYAVGLSLNEYNAFGNDATDYSWNTQYAGVENTVSYSFVHTSGFDVDVHGGLGFSTIVYGKQEINGNYFDLTSQKEFSGLVISPKLGLQGAYNIEKEVFFSLGFNYCKGFNVTNSTSESLSFNTYQIQLGIHVSMN